MLNEVLRRSAVVALLAFSATGAAACSGAPTEGTAADPAGAQASAPEANAQSSEALTGAVDCGAMIRSHAAFVRSNTCSYGGSVGYQIVTHQSSGLVSIASGWLNQQTQGLSYINPITHLPITTPTTISSSGTVDGYQTFSDRYAIATIRGDGYASSLPFNPRAQDQLKVTLRDDGKAVVKFVSWGGGEITVTPTECMNNLMYGFGGGVLYSIRLEDQCTLG